MMTFGSRLKAALKQRGRTQTWLGEEVGRSKGAISQWISGDGEPDLATLARVCKILGVSADYLVLGVEAPHYSAQTHQFAQRFEQCPPETRDALLRVFGTAATDERVAQFIKPAPRSSRKPD